MSLASDDKTFNTLKNRFIKQTRNRFFEKKTTVKVQQQALDNLPRTRSESRSTTSIIAAPSTPESTQRITDGMSRLHFEDLLRCLQGAPLKLFVSKSAARNTDLWWGDTFIQALAAQPSVRPLYPINAELFYSFDVTILNATLHQFIKDGHYSEDQLKELYSRKQGFSISIQGDRTINLPFTWQQVVEFSSSLMFFGPLVSRNRVYSDLFKNVTDLKAIRSIYLWFMFETAGDVDASHELSNAYLIAENKALTSMYAKLMNTTRVMSIEEIIPPDGNSILSTINSECRQAIRDATTSWCDPYQPFITSHQYDRWIDGVTRGFPQMWANFSHARGLTARKKDNSLYEGKRRMVLHQILCNFRQRNNHSLTWWTMIESLALMAWSVGRTAYDRLAYWGTHLSASSRDRLFASLFDQSQQQQLTDCLVDTAVLIFIIDNYQRGMHLKQQRGQHSSVFLSGTNKLAEKAFLYDNPEYNSRKPLDKLSFSGHDVIVSADGMPPYEDFDGFAPAKYLAEHKDVPSHSHVDFSGKRVAAYAKLLDLTDRVREIRRVFIENGTILHHFPSVMNKNNLETFIQDCRQSECVKLFTAARRFQKDAVLKWNPTAEEVTPTIVVGLDAMEEAASMETGAIVLSLLMKAGVMTVDGDGKFQLGDTTKFVMLFGDVKTVDNINLIQDTIRQSMQGKGFDEASHQLSVFDKALERVMDVPGDWHAGLSMLTSIVTLFFDVLLHPICKALKWKRFNRETNKCYFQSSRLVAVIHEVLLKVTYHRFISEKYEELKTEFEKLVLDADLAMGDDNFICYCANQFSLYVKEDLECSDEWRRLCALFLLLSTDFLSFVVAYRTGDAIKVELAYERFAPVWRVVGASRYLERVWRQQESLYTKFHYKELMIVRRNRSSRPYHGSTGKKAHAKDEKMELFNSDYSRFAMPRTQEKFVDESKKTLIVKKGKNTVVSFYSLRPLKSTKSPPKSASKKVDNPQLNFIYELLVKMGTMDLQEDRTITSDAVTKCAALCTTRLKLSSVDDRMTDKREYDSDKILSTMRQCILEREDVNDTNLSEEDKAAIAEEAQADDDEYNAEIEGTTTSAEKGGDTTSAEKEGDTTNGTESDVGKKAKEKRGFDTNCLTDVWKVGLALISKDNIQETRTQKSKRFVREKKLMDAIGKFIKNAESNNRQTRLDKEAELEDTPQWLAKCSEISRFS